MVLPLSLAVAAERQQNRCHGKQTSENAGCGQIKIAGPERKIFAHAQAMTFRC